MHEIMVLIISVSSRISGEFVRIADFTGLPYFSVFLLGLKSQGLITHDYLSQSTLLPLPRRGVAMCSRPASKYKRKFCFVRKQACIHCMQSKD